MALVAKRRIAVIDIGTVTCRMLVADVYGNGSFHELTREYAIANLGEGVDATRRLKPAAIERVAVIVERYLAILGSLEGARDVPTDIVALATSASRDAENAAVFEARLAKLGVSLKVISGQEEAALSFAGATAEFSGEQVVVVDVGGGSTEVVAGRSGAKPVFAHSFDIGCRRVTDRFLHSDPPTQQEIDQARMWIRSTMAPRIGDLRKLFPACDLKMVAVAGTATSVVSMREHMVEYDRNRVHKARVTLAQLEALADDLARVTLAERRKTVGLDPDRAPVIVAGLLVLSEVMKLLGTDSFVVSESDILQGVVLSTASE